MQIRSKLGNIIGKHSISIVVCLYLLSVIIRFLLMPSPARMTIYNDEFRSYGIAESIATGRGLSQFNKESQFVEILYCLVIAPAFGFRSDRVLQFQIIGAINSILICSGIFPTYLLAKRISRGNTRIALLFSAIYSVLPDLTYSLLFYSENIQLPMAMWLIYIIYITFDDVEKEISRRYLINQLLIGLLFFLLYLSKMLSLIFPISYFLVILLEVFLNVGIGRNKAEAKKRWSGFAVAISVFVVLITATFKMFLGGRNFLRTGPMDPNVLDSPAKYLYLLYGVLYYLINAVLATGIVPIILATVNFKKLSSTEKLIFAFLIIALGGLAVVNSYTCTLREDFPRLVPKANVRYACWFFLPMWMIYSNTLAEKLTHIRKRILLAAGVLIGLFYVVVYKGVNYSQADQTMLWYLINFSEKQTRYVSVLILVFLVICILLLFKSPKMHALFFGSVMLLLMLFDNVYTTKDRIWDHKISEHDYSEISVVESFIKQHPEDEFLYIINDRTIDKYQKLGDSYLNYRNVTRMSLFELLKNQQVDGTINLSNVEIDRQRQISKIDYLILEQDWEAEYVAGRTDDETVSSYYDVIRVDDEDNKVIPAIGFWWTIPVGTKTFDVSRPHFSTQFVEDDLGGFVSKDGESGTLLFGPYTVLPKGKYDITFLYTYNGELEAGTPLGNVGVRGSEALSSYDTAFYAGEDSATISDITISDFCTQFETLMLTSKGGIRVYAIKVTRKE